MVGLNGNAYSLLGAFSRAARRAGWTKDEISVVISEAMAGDYNHLLNVLMDHCEPDDDSED